MPMRYYLFILFYYLFLEQISYVDLAELDRIVIIMNINLKL